jgi:hypothetical protein
MNPFFNRTLGLVALCSSLITPTQGQENPVPPQNPPAAPFVIFPQGRLHYTIEVQPGSGDRGFAPTLVGAQQGKVPTTIDITISPPNERWVTHWADGKETETWFIRELVVIESAYGNWANVFNTGTLPEDALYPVRESDVSTLALNLYKGVVRFQDTKCYRFDLSIMSAFGGAPHTRSIWISTSTRVPVAVSEWNHVFVFKFDPAEPDNLQVPPKIAADLAKNGFASDGTLLKNP